MYKKLYEAIYIHYLISSYSDPIVFYTQMVYYTHFTDKETEI